MAIVTLVALFLPSAASAQDEPGVEVTTGIRRLHYSYRFENDSSFDTPFLVPHFFEQRYEVTSPEVGLRARYRVKGQTWSTTVSFMPERRAFGSDFDTFFQPEGDIATSGTAGDVDLMGLAIAQTIPFVSRDRWSLALRIAWRRDRADYLPADRVVTHTQPPSETREWITDGERTVSRTFESGAAVAWQPAIDGRWSLDFSAYVSPTIHARLLTQLPQKYPGRDIVFDALAWSVGGNVSLSRPVGPFTAGAWMSVEKAGSYRRSARFNRTAVAGGISVGLLR